MAQHRDAGIFHDVADKAAGAAGDDEIHQPFQLQQGLDLGTAGEQLQRSLGKLGDLLQPRLDGRHQCLAGAERLRATLEQDAVAGFHRQGGNLHQSIGPRLEDHPQHSQRVGAPLQHQPLIQFPDQQGLPHRIRQPQHLPHPGHRVGQFLGVQLQAGVGRGGQLTGLDLLRCLLQIRLVGCQDGLLVFQQSGGHGL